MNLPPAKKDMPFLLVYVLYFILFYAAWAAYTLLLKPVISEAFDGDILPSLIGNLLKCVIWILPAALLIRKYRSQCAISLKEMFTTKVKWLNYLPVAAFFVVYLLVSAFRTHGSIGITETFSAADVIVVIFVGITEEIVFRGFLLNATVKADSPPNKQYLAIGINAVLFLSIHFPIWILEDRFVSSFADFGFLSILILSVVFSVTFLKSKNLLVPIVLHMLWDLLIFMMI